MVRAVGIGVAVLAAGGCDSALPYRADLGQTGRPPALEATLTVSKDGQLVSFSGTPSASAPEALFGARSARLVVGGAQLPLVATGSALMTLIPAGVTVSRPVSSTATESLVFVIDGERVLVAEVSYR